MAWGQAQKSVVRKLIRLHKVDLLLLHDIEIHMDFENVIFGAWGS